MNIQWEKKKLTETLRYTEAFREEKGKGFADEDPGSRDKNRNM